MANLANNPDLLARRLRFNASSYWKIPNRSKSETLTGERFFSTQDLESGADELRNIVRKTPHLFVAQTTRRCRQDQLAWSKTGK